MEYPVQERIDYLKDFEKFNRIAEKGHSEHWRADHTNKGKWLVALIEYLLGKRRNHNVNLISTELQNHAQILGLSQTQLISLIKYCRRFDTFKSLTRATLFLPLGFIEAVYDLLLTGITSVRSLNLSKTFFAFGIECVLSNGSVRTNEEFKTNFKKLLKYSKIGWKQSCKNPDTHPALSKTIKDLNNLSLVNSKRVSRVSSKLKYFSELVVSFRINSFSPQCTFSFKPNRMRYKGYLTAYKLKKIRRLGRNQLKHDLPPPSYKPHPDFPPFYIGASGIRFSPDLISYEVLMSLLFKEEEFERHRVTKKAGISKFLAHELTSNGERQLWSMANLLNYPEINAKDRKLPHNILLNNFRDTYPALWERGIKIDKVRVNKILKEMDLNDYKKRMNRALSVQDEYPDGRFRGFPKIHSTISGRTQYQSPEIISIRKKWREVFVPDKGKVLLSLDITTANFLIMLGEMKSNKWNEVLQAGIDPYEDLGERIGMSRREVKKAIHPWLNGAGRTKIAEELGTHKPDLDKADTFLNGLEQQAPELIQFKKSQNDYMRLNDASRPTPLGYQVVNPFMKKHSFSGMGSYHQSVIAEIMMSLIVDMSNAQKEGKLEFDLIFFIHDEILLSINESPSEVRQVLTESANCFAQVLYDYVSVKGEAIGNIGIMQLIPKVYSDWGTDITSKYIRKPTTWDDVMAVKLPGHNSKDLPWTL